MCPAFVTPLGVGKWGRNVTNRPLTQLQSNKVSVAKMGLDRTDTVPATGLPVSRRDALRFMLSGVIGATIGQRRPEAANADRTGKYSTKLTAKRRYLPRIARGIKVLKSDSRESTYKEISDDFLTALRLFGTSYFAEGNRIGKIEKELTEIVETMEEETRAINQTSGDKGHYDALVSLVEKYVEIAKIEDSLVSFSSSK